jgi:hypothetical protein
MPIEYISGSPAQGPQELPSLLNKEEKATVLVGETTDNVIAHVAATANGQLGEAASREMAINAQLASYGELKGTPPQTAAILLADPQIQALAAPLATAQASSVPAPDEVAVAQKLALTEAVSAKLNVQM